MATAQAINVGQGADDGVVSAGTTPLKSDKKELFVCAPIAVLVLSAAVADATSDFGKLTGATTRPHASRLTVPGFVHIPEIMDNPNDGSMNPAFIRLEARPTLSSGPDETTVQALQLRRNRLFQFAELLAP